MMIDQARTQPFLRLSLRPDQLSLAGRLLWLFSVAIGAGASWLWILNRNTALPPRWGFSGMQIWGGLAIGLVALIVMNRRPEHFGSWFLLLMSFQGVLMGFGEEYSAYAVLTQPGSLHYSEYAAIVTHWLWIPITALGVTLTLNFPSPGEKTQFWTYFERLAYVLAGFVSLRTLLHPGPLYNMSFVDNPLALPPPYTDLPLQTGSLLFWYGSINVLMLIVPLSLIQRYRTADFAVKQQIKWLFIGLGTIFAGSFAGYFQFPYSEVLQSALGLGLPICIGIAIVRHQLWDVDFLINRTLVYGGLSALLLGLYTLMVFSSGLLTQSGGAWPALVLTLLLVSVFYRPVSAFIKQRVDQLIPLPSARRTVPEIQARGPDSIGAWEKVQPFVRVVWWLSFILAAVIFVAALPEYQGKFTGQLSHAVLVNPTVTSIILIGLAGITSLISAVFSLWLAWLLFRRSGTQAIVMLVSFTLILYAVVLSGPLEFWMRSVDGATGSLLRIQALALSLPLVSLMIVFPNGRIDPRASIGLFWLGLIWSVVILLVPESNLDLSAGVPAPILSILAVGYLILLAGAFYVQFFRYRHLYTALEQEQARWVLFGFGMWAVYLVLSSVPYFWLSSQPVGQPAPWWVPISELFWWLSTAILPATLFVSVAKARLWNIDVVINRTLLYASMTLVVLVVYGGVVGVMGLAFRSSSNLLIPMLATGIAALLFNPLRQRFQGNINRMMYGDRDDPVAVLAQLGANLETTGSPEAALQGIVETVSRALKLPHAAIELKDAQNTRFEFGESEPELVRFPLSYQGESIGELQVAPRSPGEALTAKDRRLLETVAGQSGAAAHTVRLNKDLRRSRRRLVAAREEERRRIRRDLHDGLGPLLASQTLTLDAVEKLLERDPDQARNLIRALKAQSDSAVKDIRHLIYDLRPPELDNFGLLTALKHTAERLSTPNFHVSIDQTEMLPALPAAVELAAFRIAQEGMNNAVRHSGGTRCDIVLEIDACLTLCIQDDGDGIQSDAVPGLGLGTIRERVEELQGLFDIQTGSEGTALKAAFPLE
jgi:signal transduction histidine kinase